MDILYYLVLIFIASLLILAWWRFIDLIDYLKERQKKEVKHEK